jgi:hypothetical protein
MRNFYTLVILFLVAVCSSCTATHVYIPALYNHDIAYQPKPASWDSTKFATYVSAGYYASDGSNVNDDLESGQLNISQAYTGKNFNIAYGAFGVAGNYIKEPVYINTVKDSAGFVKEPEDFNKKFFGAVGGRFSANLYSHSGRVDFRYIGVEAVYSHEFGDYANYRRSVVNQPGFNVDTRTDLVSLGATSEILFHRRRDNNFENGFRLFIGSTFGPNPPSVYELTSPHQDNSSKLFTQVAYFFKYKKFFGSAELGDGLFMRVGLKL